MDFALPHAGFPAASGNDEFQRAFERAVKLLGIRARSRRELSDRLLSMGFGPVTVERVDERLASLGLVDDREYALERVRHLLSRGRSSRAARDDLAARGITEEQIGSSVDELAPEGDDAERAVALARRRAAGIAGLDPATAYRRVARYLGAQGYDAETVQEACWEVFGEGHEPWSDSV